MIDGSSLFWINHFLQKDSICQGSGEVGCGFKHFELYFKAKIGEDLFGFHMGVSKNRGTPKWMVKIMENPIF